MGSKNMGGNVLFQPFFQIRARANFCTNWVCFLFFANFLQKLTKNGLKKSQWQCRKTTFFSEPLIVIRDRGSFAHANHFPTDTLILI